MELPQSTAEKEFQNMFDSIRDYPFAELDSKLQKLDPKFYGKKFLDPAEFSQSGVNSEILDQVKESISHGRVAMLVANIRAGTSSVMKSWIAEDPQNRVSIPTFLNDIPKVIDKKGVCLDEMEALPERVQLVEDLKDNHDLIIRPHLVGVEFYRQELKERGIKFDEIKMKPLDAEQMRVYLARKMDLKTDDKFVNFITQLAGGSIFLANDLADNFIGNLNLEGITKELQEEMVNPYIRDIHNKRSKLPSDLAECLPNPFMEKLMYQK